MKKRLINQSRRKLKIRETSLDSSLRDCSDYGEIEGLTLIAFLVLAHADPVQVKRLVERLHPHDVYIHLDARTRRSAEWDDIDATFIKHRVPVYWAGFGQVEATLVLLEAAHAAKSTYDHYVFLSGSDYPIRPISELESLFEREPKINFMKFVPVEGSGHLPTLIDHFYFRDAIGSWRLNSKFKVLALGEKAARKVLESCLRPLKRYRLTNWTPFYGSGLWAITEEAVLHILATVASSEGQQLMAYYRRSFASDEQFFHTVIGNSVLAESSTGLQDYVGRGTHLMANLHLIDPSLAKWFELSDMPEIEKSSMYFVRKVRTSSSSSLLDALDRRVT